MPSELEQAEGGSRNAHYPQQFDAIASTSSGRITALAIDELDYSLGSVSMARRLQHAPAGERLIRAAKQAAEMAGKLIEKESKIRADREVPKGQRG